MRSPVLCLLSFALLLASSPAQEAPAVAKGIDSWMKAYRQNKLEFGSRADIGSNSIGRKAGALPRGLVGLLSLRRELEAMLEQAAKRETELTLLATLSVAAVGQDDVRYEAAAMPLTVRTIGEAALLRFESDESHAVLERVARDGHKGASKGISAGMQAAALRALAPNEAGAYRTLWRDALAHADADVRAAAADALARRGTVDDAATLVTSLGNERDGAAIRSLATALLTILQRSRAAFDVAARDALGTAAIGAIGRSEWRIDMVLVELAESARSARAIPGLIDLLDRFVQDPKSVRSGALSGVLRHRTYEALLALTGAAFGMEDPAKWREWFAQNGEKLEISAEPPAGKKGQTSSGFFGIPVRGTRVMFVIDLSKSMEAQMRPLDRASGTSTEWTTRLAVAREQVWDAVQHLSEDAMFDIAVFSESSRAWEGKLVIASDTNRKKAKRFLDELNPEPYTNLWAGLMLALEFGKGSNAAENLLQLDELFILSDGAPTIGEVTDSREILRLVTEANRGKGLCINTVFLQGEGSTMDPDIPAGQMGPAELMEELAKANGGRFVKH